MKTCHGRSLAVAVLLAVLTGCGGGAAGEPQASTPSATRSPSPDAIPAGTAPIEPGTYRIPSSAWSMVEYTVTFPEGWTVQDGVSYFKRSDAPDELGFGFEAFVPDTIYADACEGSQGELMEVGSSVDDLAAALFKQRGPMASAPVDTTLGGYPAIRIDLTVPKGFDLKPCNLPDALQVWFSHPADRYVFLLPREIASLYIVDVDGQRQVFQAHYGSATQDEDVRELRAVLDSIHIET
jgi:hypothetical protein